MIYSILLLMALKMAPAAGVAHQLTAQVNGIEKNKGFIMAELKDASGKVVQQLRQDVKASGKALLFKDLPTGSYALAVFHDANADGKLNTNLVGIPTEKYGFSNDARGVFGPPSLADQLIKVDADRSISVTVK